MIPITYRIYRMRYLYDPIGEVTYISSVYQSSGHSTLTDKFRRVSSGSTIAGTFIRGQMYSYSQCRQLSLNSTPSYARNVCSCSDLMSNSNSQLRAHLTYQVTY